MKKGKIENLKFSKNIFRITIYQLKNTIKSFHKKLVIVEGSELLCI